MRDKLSDIGGEEFLSDKDPMRRAQKQMRPPLPKRFYKEAEVAREGDAYAVRLDGRPVRTPGKALLALPSERAARLVADEFAAQRDEIDPISMPVLRLANTAIDGVAADTQAVLEDIMRFASSDLLCYRADAPEGLVARQAEAWDPIIDWARASLGARFILAEGVMHVEQPGETIGAIGIHLKLREDPFRLSALHVMTSLMGSALLALAVEAGEIDAETAWAAAHVDEDWNIEKWGEDAEAVERRAVRKRDMLASVSLLGALSFSR
ncbi:ATP12 family protein [Aquamicrobium sp. LC103]|uniref:ATP12 family chaperone protein n=1 Tax=Aquamicrobium sp. LC103 TaxID=1120658 RepID=UPI00063E7F8E|nr:ATP12 family protein [Aquamicrobium sp. LC103]TKT79287.1 ATPase [Aquamicrobium sp. LC103]